MHVRPEQNLPPQDALVPRTVAFTSLESDHRAVLLADRAAMAATEGTDRTGP
jgi:hypothetical protein